MKRVLVEDVPIGCMFIWHGSTYLRIYPDNTIYSGEVTSIPVLLITRPGEIFSVPPGTVRAFSKDACTYVELIEE